MYRSEYYLPTMKTLYKYKKIKIIITDEDGSVIDHLSTTDLEAEMEADMDVSPPGFYTDDEEFSPVDVAARIFGDVKHLENTPHYLNPTES